MNILKNDLLGESVKSFEVNGLKVYVVEKNQFSIASASFAIKYGSNDISFKSDSEDEFRRYPLGIAHFLEHKMFDGEGDDEVFKKFSEIGSEVNAYTSNNITNYYFSTINNFEKSLEYLCEMIYNLNLTDERVEKEKPIIEQELRMYDDDPYNRVYRNLLSVMYNKHPVRFDIGGDVNTIKNIEKSHLEDCYNKFYSNNNMFLVLVGNVKAEECKAMLERFIVNKSSGNIVREKFDMLDGIDKHYIDQDMKMSVPTNLIGFKDVTRSTNYIRKLIVFEMIHRMFFRATSNFYEKIYKDGIINGSYYTDYVNENEYGHYLFGGDGDSFKKLPEILFNHYNNYDFSKDKHVFERVKKAMYGNYINLFNNIDHISQLMIKLINNNLNIFDYFDELSRITLDDIVFEFKNIFNESNMVYSRVV